MTFDRALSGPFNKLRSAGLSASPALCKGTIYFYLHFNGFMDDMKLFIFYYTQQFEFVNRKNNFFSSTLSVNP
jgi:hypothetical protein